MELFCVSVELLPQSYMHQTCAATGRVCMYEICVLSKLIPSDSVTTTAKNLMAPLTSLNQLQLNLKKMEDLVTTADVSLTRVLSGGGGGPAGVTPEYFRKSAFRPWPCLLNFDELYSRSW